MRTINKIIIHCTATPEGRIHTLEDVTKWHKQIGYKTIGYHYLIGINGEVWKGRPDEQIGAHTKGYNTHSIGICYVGGLTANKKTAKDTRTEIQKKVLKTLVEELKVKYLNATIHGHNEFSNKACPSFNVQQWLKEINIY